MKKQLLLIAIFTALYLSTHLYNLTALPIFADEAIYIRWAQLIIDDWRQYLFFPLNDGKTPFFIWLLVPFLEAFDNQLLAARLVSVLVGLLQAAILYRLTKTMGGKRLAAWLSAGLVVILPYWYFHHRMALMDSMLTFWLSVTVWLTLMAVHAVPPRLQLKWSTLRQLAQRKWLVIYTFAAGGSFAAALWTKLPAVLLIPVLGLFAIVSGKRGVPLLVSIGVVVGIVGLGYSLFFSQALHPAFPQLFSRGSDFLYSVDQLLAGEVLHNTVPSVPNYAWYFVAYATVPFWILLLIGLFYGKHKLAVHVLFWSGVLFVLPIVVLGRVVYPRYLLPAMLFFTPAAALAIEGLIEAIQHKKLQSGTLFVTVSLVVLVANIGNFSARFMIPALFNPESMPLVSADTEQYLLEWSSGHGIAETASALTQAAEKKKIAVATEGYFGTLPDGLLVYFHNKSVENIFIEGIGQPVQSIPESFLDKTTDADERWLVVNSHRLHMIPPGELLAEYCRPMGAPCLQVWRIHE